MINLQTDNWSREAVEELVDFLRENADEKYKSFNSSLIPNADKGKMLGVRLPKLREIGRGIAKGNPRSFAAAEYSDIYEITLLRGIVTGLIKPRDFEDLRSLCDSYIPKIDSWSVCDTFCTSLKYIKKYRKEFFEYLSPLLESENPWKIRVALVIMLGNYLDGEYIDRVLERSNKVNNDSYYVSMANAWLAATAVAKCPEQGLEFMKNNSLDDETFNRAVQKCIDSYRVNAETKAVLRSMKRKPKGR